MNTQTIIQRLIEDELITAALMYAHENEPEKIHMLAACATGQVITYNQATSIVYELQNNRHFYAAAISQAARN
jgi:hypothetical protein